MNALMPEVREDRVKTHLMTSRSRAPQELVDVVKTCLP
jgi:hypothetical protein